LRIFDPQRAASIGGREWAAEGDRGTVATRSAAG
jgi:hypothetical protein